MLKEQIKRIIDVNTNRAVEGLRVCEEITRFVLQDVKITNELKQLRARLRSSITKMMGQEIHFNQREAGKDIGRALYTQSEAHRASLTDLFMANIKRAQEALRVLEEFSKLFGRTQGKAIKNLRFKVYELEKQVYYPIKRREKLDLDLYLLTDPMRNHLEVTKSAVAAGVKIIQLRDKTATKAELLKTAKLMRRITAPAKVALIINDYPDIAEKVGADGVHLGQEDLNKRSIRSLRKKLGPEKIIGVSVTNLVQAKQAAKDGADYVAIGPIYSTTIKADIKPLGLKIVRRLIEDVKIPVVAIGGINAANLEKIWETGCRRIAVIRAVLGQQNMIRASKDLQRKITELRRRLP